MILNFVSGCKCYKTLMYPVNVYSFTTAAPLQTYCTLGAYQENSHRKVALKICRSTTSQSSNATLAIQKHIHLQILSLKQVVGSHWPSKDMNPIAGSHICRVQFIKGLQVGIFGHLQVYVIISWLFPHR